MSNDSLQFQGGPSGLRQKPSQIILASDIPGPPISTLGYSLAGGLDMDFNNHTDLLVGAYESDTVVILRARPVIDIVTWFGNKTVRINPSKLGCDMDPTSEEVCFQVSFTHLNIIRVLGLKSISIPVPPAFILALIFTSNTNIPGGVLFPNPQLPCEHRDNDCEVQDYQRGLWRGQEDLQGEVQLQLWRCCPLQ